MSADFRVSADGIITGPACRGRCSLGRGGVVPDKREGDGASPLGVWQLRQVFYRPDREAPPWTRLLACPLAPEDGWCDDPNAGVLYNQPLSLPSAFSCEAMWRDDACYDLVVALGYNDAPAQAGRGSAIFIHLARDGFAPTEGCIGLERRMMLHILRAARPGSLVEILG